ncbi:hypothetical protein FRC09_007521 [Ceratobasidium sp. 395]|nr:hypothetical protein FRC09_007521 [Ceratobasidium sp. 395]
MPLREVGHTLPTDVVVVIDGIDECEDCDAVNEILSSLHAHTPDLPIKFLVTGRPTSNIVEHMRSEQGDSVYLELRLDEPGHPSVKEDVRTFIRAELYMMNLSADGLERLVGLSGGSFSHAAVCVRYMQRSYLTRGAKRARRMQQASGALTTAGDQGNQGTDFVCNAILEAALEVGTFGGPDLTELKHLLHTVVCAPEPLTVETLAGLLSVKVSRLERYGLEALRLLLHVPEVDGPVMLQREALRSYLLDQNRSGDFFCDPGLHNVWLAQTCFDLIKTPTADTPDANPKLLPRSHPVSEGTQGLDTLSPQIWYAYRHWGAHARLAGYSRSNQAAEKLKQVLDASSVSDSDSLCKLLLRRTLNHTTAQNISHMVAKLLGTVVYAQGALALSAMSEFLGTDVTDLIHSLMPLLLVSDSEEVTVLHTTFSDYMRDKHRSGSLYCDAEQNHVRLARTCFDLLKSPSPPFNICDLPSSHLLDSETPNIEKKINEAISSGLVYACACWGPHLQLTLSLTAPFLEEIHELIADRLLLWMEVLNLKQMSGKGCEILHDLYEWLETSECEDNIRLLVYDAWQFMKQFSESPASQSTPHIYVSILALWSKDRPVSRHYLPRMMGLVQFGERLGYPSNSEYLVPGSENQPRPGHSDSVNSVTYSSDGAYIASGSKDKTVRIWNAGDGQPVGQPLKGHEDYVRSVAYSPDGSRIASGSYDKTIRIWDAETGQAIGQPLKGHTRSVTALVKSSCGSGFLHQINSTNRYFAHYAA